MERDNYKNYNLLYNTDNDSIIGFVEDIRQYYKAAAKNYIDLEIFNETRDFLDLLDNIDIKLHKRDLIEVYYHEFKMRYEFNVLKVGK